MSKELDSWSHSCQGPTHFGRVSVATEASYGNSIPEFSGSCLALSFLTVFTLSSCVYVSLTCAGPLTLMRSALPAVLAVVLLLRRASRVWCRTWGSDFIRNIVVICSELRACCLEPFSRRVIHLKHLG